MDCATFGRPHSSGLVKVASQLWWRSSMQEAPFVDKNISTVSSTECKFHCTNGTCLLLDSLICNGFNDCGDNSDEGNCPALTQHPPPAIFTSELEFVQIIVVMLVVAVMVVAIICLLNHYKFSTWFLLTRQNEGRMQEESLQQGPCVWPLDNAAVQPASEVRGVSPPLFRLDVCSTLDYPRTQKAAPSLGGNIKAINTTCGLRPRERFPAQMFTQCDQPCRFQPTYPYLQHDIDLPPTISLSDGEEPPPYQGPCTLQLRDPEQQMELNRESVRAPPNRTVFDSDLIHVRSAGGPHPPSSNSGVSASSGHEEGPPPAYSEVMEFLTHNEGGQVKTSAPDKHPQIKYSSI